MQFHIAEQIQCVATLNLYSRSIVYVSNLVTNNTKKSESYDKPKAISIWIIRDMVGHGSVLDRCSPIEEVSYCLNPNNIDKEYKQFNDKARIIWIQLYKFRNEEVKNKMNKILNDWLTFFNEPKKVTSTDTGINKAVHLFDRLSSPEQKKAQIRAIEKYEMDRGSEIATAMHMGERKKAIETAKNMLSDNLPIDVVAKYTGLSIEEIKSLE